MGRIFHFATAWSFALLLFAGCASAPDGTPSLPALAKGMTGEDVLQSWGAPDGVKPYTFKGQAAKIWVYEVNEKRTTGQEVVGFTYWTYVDPITGDERQVPEPVYEVRQEEITITTQLLMIDNQLIDWKRSSDSREFY